MFLPVVALAANIALSPTPAPLKEIARVRSRAVCTTLHTLVIPAARISKETEPIFESLAGNVRSIARVVRDMNVERGTGHDSAAGAFVAALTTLPAANADWETSQILVKLVQIDRLLLASYATNPQGSNRAVDALRQRIQNMVDLQRAYANAMRAAPAAMLDNAPLGGDDPFSGTTPAAPAPAADRPVVPGAAAAYIPGKPLAARDLKFIPAASLAGDLAAEEKALVPAALAAVRNCD